MIMVSVHSTEHGNGGDAACCVHAEIPANNTFMDTLESLQDAVDRNSVS